MGNMIGQGFRVGNWIFQMMQEQGILFKEAAHENVGNTMNPKSR